LVKGVASFCSEFRVHAAFGPPEGGTPNFKFSRHRLSAAKPTTWFLPIHSQKKTKETKNFVFFVSFCEQYSRSILPFDYLRAELCRRVESSREPGRALPHGAS
jgi:hypothetical protein